MDQKNSRKFKRSAQIVISSLFFSLSVLVVSNYYFQEQAIFQNESLPSDFIFSWKERHEEVILPLPTGERIHALHFKLDNPKGIVVYYHGRGFNLNYWGKRAKPFLDRGYEVFMIDYRGFGKSSKGLKESALLEDGIIAYNYIKALYPEDKIILYGYSLGSSIATFVASQNHPKLLLLESPFFNMIKAASFTRPYLPETLIKWILKFHMRSDLWIQKVASPIYIFHGTHDNIVPFEQGQLLFSKIPQSVQKTFIEIPHCGHTKVWKNFIYLNQLSQILD